MSNRRFVLNYFMGEPVETDRPWVIDAQGILDKLVELGELVQDDGASGVYYHLPLKKEVSITYAFIDNRYHYGCSDHPHNAIPHVAGTVFFADTQKMAESHVKDYHPNDDVFFGEVPKPPHEHHWVWSSELYGPPSRTNYARAVITCKDPHCDARFYYPEGLIAQAYTGPVPEGL